MFQTPILIIGAGPTGLVLALWLTRLGVPVRIIDRAAQPGTTSRALAVQARTLEFYRQLGLAEAVVAGGVKVAQLNFRVGGERAAQVPLRHIGEGMSPYPFALVFPQDAHERLLVGRLEALGAQVERSVELLRFVQSDDGVQATLRHADGSEETCEARFLVGCDGASSTVRGVLGVGFPGGTYSGLFYVADVEAGGPAVDDELHVDLEAADFLLMFPLRGKGRVRLVGVVRELPGREAGSLTFNDVRGRAVEHLGLEVRKVNWFSTYRVHHRVAQRFRDGRVFLLGDAAHIHSPVGGQGMNTGIGDAVNLAWKLAAVLKHGASERLLESYEAERRPFARRLVASTDRMFTLVTAPGKVAAFVRTRVVPRIAPRLLRLAPLRRFLFRTLSQIGIHYRGSPLSDGAAGGLRGGDRLPWIELAPGEDNFAPLVSMTWQVHVYGAVPAGVAEVCAAYGLPLHAFGWQPKMEAKGFRQDGVYLVRPDGYLGFVDGGGNGERLRAYLAERRGLVSGALDGSRVMRDA
ncbi:MAG: FAD-dependent monooxygenase [Xanthomonadales bacterium]|nr:FAD-dependent monooxygenase [Xanthomonadales bacterium]